MENFTVAKKVSEDIINDRYSAGDVKSIEFIDMEYSNIWKIQAVVTLSGPKRKQVSIQLGIPNLMLESFSERDL